MSLKIANSYPGAGADVELCTHQAVNVHYYKYSVGGMNIILVSILFQKSDSAYLTNVNMLINYFLN